MSPSGKSVSHRFALLGLLLVVALAFYLWPVPSSRLPDPASGVNTPAPGDPGGQVAVGAPSTPEPLVQEAASTTAGPIPTLSDEPAASQPEPAVISSDPLQAVRDGQAELEHVSNAIRSFRTAVGGNPVGTNAEITSALRGDNLKQVRVELPPTSKISEAGELTDQWSTPYFFHQLSARQMEIRSAGPDRKMWTEDDLEVK